MLSGEILQVNVTLTQLERAVSQAEAELRRNSIALPPYALTCNPSTCAPAAFLGDGNGRRLHEELPPTQDSPSDTIIPSASATSTVHVVAEDAEWEVPGTAPTAPNAPTAPDAPTAGAVGTVGGRKLQAGDFGTAQLMNGALWRNWKTAELLQLQCTPPEAFTALSFDAASLVQSNLGGKGGRCTDTCYANGGCVSWQSLCDEKEPGINFADTATTFGNMHILIRNLGTTPEGAQINLRITNESEYRAWNARHNGVKRTGAGANSGSFGVINLLGPRTPLQKPYSSYWNDLFTIVQLRYSFTTGPNLLDRPLWIGRTFITFYDFDTGAPQFEGSFQQIEAMQFGPQAAAFEVARATQLNVNGGTPEPFCT